MQTLTKGLTKSNYHRMEFIFYFIRYFYSEYVQIEVFEETMNSHLAFL